jgi:DtxR family manganese transport transcriptional regulator
MQNRFDRTRQDHRQERAEDYVELIEALIAERGEARAAYLAERLAVSQVTVSKTLQRLSREGFVSLAPYRSILLTEKGAELAAAARARHQIVLDFLLSLGVSPETAEVDAEGIEHHVSEETLAAMSASVVSRREGG